MLDLIIIGAGPGGIALAAEASASGIDPSQILILEKGPTHNSAIRQLYPEQKLTTANYKGFAARCQGLLCVGDMTKPETLQFFDKIISDHRINIEYNAEVYGMSRLEEGARFRVESSQGVYESKVLACAIGIFGRPNKPKEYRLLPSLKEKLLFDMTSHPIENEDVLVVGGGDTAAEYVQYLRPQGNRVTLSYRKADFTRLSQQNHGALLAMEQRGEVEILRSSNIKEIEDEAGRPRIIFAEPEHATSLFDRVIFALGGTTPTNFLHTLGISFNGNGPVFDEVGATNVEGLYLIGDLVVGKKGGSIITAFNSAVRAMKSICTHDLRCQSRQA
ncbi:MAG TPA: NAD(P)-binding domain-containing protein [Pyrinomonadaceae bacterium]|jgi:thioredoxin reductase (NADPH)|nr:NAD(P)-binding domain-containing protein [Pyrinomonadaceae bacterium]